MAHYAFVDDNNIVTKVITGRDEDDLIEGVTDWEAFYSEESGQRCLRTSYNTLRGEHLTGGTPYRGNYAGIGFEYREDLDAFIPAQPFPSWSLNEGIFDWEAPVPMPENVVCYWSEDDLDWVVVS